MSTAVTLCMVHRTTVFKDATCEPPVWFRITYYNLHIMAMECVDADYNVIHFPDDVVVKMTELRLEDARAAGARELVVEHTHHWYTLGTAGAYEIWRGGEPRIRLTPQISFDVAVL